MATDMAEYMGLIISTYIDWGRWRWRLGYAAHHLWADYTFRLLGLPKRLPWREADQQEELLI